VHPSEAQAPRILDGGAIAASAVHCLLLELETWPKPGLVSAMDAGAHGDMSLATFYRSIVALRSYFPTIAALGAAGAPWQSLAAHGQAAEAVMLGATGGVNTHRGAIFPNGMDLTPRPMAQDPYLGRLDGRHRQAPRR